MQRVILFVLALSLAGCTDTYGPEEAEASVSGSFTADRTNADLQEFQQIVDKHNGEAVIMESFPEQFRATALETDCYLLVTELEDKEYIASIGACQPID